MITEDSHFYLPNLYTFQNGNSFYGSYRGLRFLIAAEEWEGEKVFGCKVWYGEYCLAESQVVDEAIFPMDEEGYDRVLNWLDVQYHKLQETAL